MQKVSIVGFCVGMLMACATPISEEVDQKTRERAEYAIFQWLFNEAKERGELGQIRFDSKSYGKGLLTNGIPSYLFERGDSARTLISIGSVRFYPASTAYVVEVKYRNPSPDSSTTDWFAIKSNATGYSVQNIGNVVP